MMNPRFFFCKRRFPVKPGMTISQTASITVYRLLPTVNYLRLLVAFHAIHIHALHEVVVLGDFGFGEVQVHLHALGERRASGSELLVTLEFSLLLVGELAGALNVLEALVDVHISLAELLMDNRYDTCRLCTFLIGLLFLLFREWNHIYLTLIWRILNKLA